MHLKSIEGSDLWLNVIMKEFLHYWLEGKKQLFFLLCSLEGAEEDSVLSLGGFTSLEMYYKKLVIKMFTNPFST